MRRNESLLMQKLTVEGIGGKISQAGRLKTRPLCIYGSETVPEDSKPTKSMNRCIAQAIFTLAVSDELKSIHIGNDELKGCCPGGLAWFGFKEFLPMLKYFLSTGIQEFRNGAAEFLVANPDLAEQRIKTVGKIRPLGKYIIIRTCKNTPNDIYPASILCFGEAEQIRNLATLICFSAVEAFELIKMPFGPSCGSFVTFPSGMAENTPKDCVILGPTDPTGNHWFPPNYLSLGIPIGIAQRISADLDDSFIIKRPMVAYPEKRTIFKSLKD